MAVLVIAGIVALNVNLSAKKSDAISLLALANIEALAQNESGTYTCTSGGPGSTSCSTSATIGGGKVGGGTSCSVSCNSGYYACCNNYHNKCQCRKS